MRNNIFIKLACALFCCNSVFAQQDSLFITWDFSAPFSMELPKAVYYHFNDTLTNPWQAHPYPNPNTGEFLIASNRYKETLKLIVKEAGGKIRYEEEIEIKDFYYKPDLTLGKGIYYISIIKEGKPEITQKMGVMAEDTVELRRMKQRQQLNSKVQRKFSIGITPNPCSGKFAILIENGTSEENEILDLTISRESGEILESKKIATLKGVGLPNIELKKGKYLISVKNKKNEISAKHLIVQ